MRGEVTGVWPWTWGEIWLPLAQREDAPADFFCEVYREIAGSLRFPPSVEALADIIDDPELSRKTFQAITPELLKGEYEAVRFLEEAHTVIADFGEPGLTDAYTIHLQRFIESFSLRYDLQQPCKLSPTLPGLFASLMRDLRAHTSRNTHLRSLMEDFECAVRDLHQDQSDRRIRTCIQKQVNLLEAVARASPGVSQATLGRMCDQLQMWPHDKIREAMKNLYHFTCDYPGIRHGGTPENAKQTIGPRDLIAVSIVLAGFVPYLCEQLDPLAIYGGR